MKILFNIQTRILFIAAIFNFLFALVAITSPAFFFSQFFKYPPDPRSTFPYLAMDHYLFWGLVLVMGIAFWMAAIDPLKNKIILFIGSLGKLITATFCLMLFIQGHGKWLMLTVTISEGIFGILMLYLYFGKNSSTTNESEN